jgi:hypothetical protein
MKAPFPERAAAPGGFVKALHVALIHLFHDPRASTMLVRSKKQVHVVRHEAIRVDRASILRGRDRQQSKVMLVMRFSEEARLPIDSALHQMQGNVGKDQSAAAGHTPATDETGLRLTPLQRNRVRPHFSR